MYNRIILTCLGFALFINNNGFSQAQIDFQETTYDFGQVKEGTVAVHEFIFTNNGDQPLVLTAVKASCGCTTPSWSKEPILPGKQGHIKASYNSKNRPGGFHKSITVTSNAKTPTKVVYIKGVAVKSTSLQPLFTEDEIANSPKITVSPQHSQIGKVQLGSSVPIKLTIQNDGKNPLEIKGIYATCRCLSLLPGKNLIVDPMTDGVLELVYTPKNQGEFTHGAHILSNDLIQPKYQVYLTSTVLTQANKTSVVKESPSKISF